MQYIISQILATLSLLILLGYSLIKVSRKTILICNIVINLLLAFHYVLLGAAAGAACTFVCVLMIVVFFFKEKWNLKIYVPILFAVMFIIFGIITWQNAWSLIPIVGNIILIIAFWSDTEFTIKSLFIIVAFLWMIYNFVCSSYVGLGGQTLSFLFNIFYIVKSLKKRNQAMNSSKSDELKSIKS